MTTKFKGVLITTHRKHLLVNRKTRRTACGKVMRSGTVLDGLHYWNAHAPLQCKRCFEEWEKSKKE